MNQNAKTSPVSAQSCDHNTFISGLPPSPIRGDVRFNVDPTQLNSEFERVRLPTRIIDGVSRSPAVRIDIFRNKMRLTSWDKTVWKSAVISLTSTTSEGPEALYASIVLRAEVIDRLLGEPAWFWEIGGDRIRGQQKNFKVDIGGCKPDYAIWPERQVELNSICDDAVSLRAAIQVARSFTSEPFNIFSKDGAIFGLSSLWGVMARYSRQFNFSLNLPRNAADLTVSSLTRISGTFGLFNQYDVAGLDSGNFRMMWKADRKLKEEDYAQKFEQKSDISLKVSKDVFQSALLLADIAADPKDRFIVLAFSPKNLSEFSILASGRNNQASGKLPCELQEILAPVSLRLPIKPLLDASNIIDARELSVHIETESRKVLKISHDRDGMNFTWIFQSSEPSTSGVLPAPRRKR